MNPPSATRDENALGLRSERARHLAARLGGKWPGSAEMRPKGGRLGAKVWKWALWVWKPCNLLKSHKTAKDFFGNPWTKTREFWKSLPKSLEVRHHFAAPSAAVWEAGSQVTTLGAFRPVRTSISASERDSAMRSASIFCASSPRSPSGGS